jgi:hypothetical protein
MLLRLALLHVPDLSAGYGGHDLTIHDEIRWQKTTLLFPLPHSPNLAELLYGLNFSGPAHVRHERVRDSDGTILVEIIFKYRDERAANSDA